MSRNFGLGSRNMSDAAQIALTREARRKTLSFSTADTVNDRFRLFAAYAKSKGVSRMERVTHALVVRYGRNLASLVCDEEISPSYAQNLVSSVNTVFRRVSPLEWEAVSPTKECGIAKRRLVRNRPTLDFYDCEEAVLYLQKNGLSRAACVAELAFRFGLRSKEASLLDARKAEREIYSDCEERFVADKGTKGGRKRTVSLQYIEEKDALMSAVLVQSDGRSIMPENETWKSWRDKGLRKGRELLHELDIKGYHEFRAAYAAKRYEDLVIDWKAPCNGGIIFDKGVDLNARQVLAEELGHGRIDVVSAYIGGRS